MAGGRVPWPILRRFALDPGRWEAPLFEFPWDRGTFAEEALYLRLSSSSRQDPSLISFLLFEGHMFVV